MTSATTITRPTAEAPDDPTIPTTATDLARVADRLGQMDLGDPRWAEEEAELDYFLAQAVQASDHARTEVWRTIAADPDSPLVVKLRTFAAAVGSLRGR